MIHYIVYCTRWTFEIHRAVSVHDKILFHFVSEYIYYGTDVVCSCCVVRMSKNGESSRPREEEVLEEVWEVREVTTRSFISDMFTASLDPIPGDTMPPILRDDTPEDQRGDFLDVHLDVIQSMATEPCVTRETREESVATVQTEGDSDEEYQGRYSTPVRGRVMRFDGYTDSEEDDDDDDHDDGDDTEIVPETDPEEDPEEAPAGEDPSEYFGDMDITTDDTIESSIARIFELEEQVHDLQEQNTVHQQVEDQYRDIAHQRHGEVTELLQAQGGLVGQLEDQTTRDDQILIERDAAQAELREVCVELRAQTTMREFIQGAWFRSADRVTQLEEQVRDGRARIHSALSAFDTAMTRL